MKINDILSEIDSEIARLTRVRFPVGTLWP
jgi:hypothetical protein